MGRETQGRGRQTVTETDQTLLLLKSVLPLKPLKSPEGCLSIRQHTRKVIQFAVLQSDCLNLTTVRYRDDSKGQTTKTKLKSPVCTGLDCNVGHCVCLGRCY